MLGKYIPGPTLFVDLGFDAPNDDPFSHLNLGCGVANQLICKIVPWIFEMISGGPTLEKRNPYVMGIYKHLRLNWVDEFIHC